MLDLQSKSLEIHRFTTDAFSLVARCSLRPTSVERTSPQLAVVVAVSAVTRGKAGHLNRFSVPLFIQV